MHTGATKMVVTQAVDTIDRRALFGVVDATLAERLNRETERFAGFGPVAVASDLAELRRQSASFSPRVILLEEEILIGAPLVESLRQLSEAAPLILVAGAARQSEIAGLVSEGDLDFVARAGDFAALAASLVERGCDGQNARKHRSALPGPVFQQRQRKYSAMRSIARSPGFWGTQSWCFLIAAACRLRMCSVCRPSWILLCGCVKPRDG
jgi:hypothetical protein